MAPQAPEAAAQRREGSGKAAGAAPPPPRAHTPFRHPSPCIVRAGPRPHRPGHSAGPIRPPAGDRLPPRPPHKAWGAILGGAKGPEKERTRTDLQGCCGRAASAGDTDRWAHGGVALGGPPPPPPSVAAMSSFSTYHPPPPPHLLLLLPLLLRTTEVPRVRHRDSQQHGCHRRLPSPPPRPPGARNAPREKGEGERSPRRGSFQCLASLLPRSRRAGRGRPARAHVLRALTCLAASPACPTPPSPCGLALPSWAPPRRGERAPGSDSVGVLLPNAVFDCLPVLGLDFCIFLPSASYPVAHCFPPTGCAGVCARAAHLGVLLAFRFRSAGAHKSRTLIQAFSFHSVPPHNQTREMHLGVEDCTLREGCHSSRGCTPGRWSQLSANCWPPVLGPGAHKGNSGRSPAGPVILTRWLFLFLAY